MSRRAWLKTLAGVAVAAPMTQLLGLSDARAAAGKAKRVIFFYFPDGVPGPSQSGDPSMWHCAGSEASFGLGQVMAPLEPWKSECLFFGGLSLGPTDSGSHPGGAKKLLTAVDHGGGVSLDQHLAKTVGSDTYFHHLYLGVQANANNASGDKHISYWAPGQSVTPMDEPLQAFNLLFGKPAGGNGAGGGASGGAPDPREVAVIDGVLEDMGALRAQLGTVEKARLDLHLEALHEVEKRIKTPVQSGGGATCDTPELDLPTAAGGALYEPEHFPAIARAQIDLMVLAMSCGLTRVGTLQLSHHTSELIMSRFAGTKMHTPGFDMRSHQASHYGAKHDLAKAEFQHFVWQREWFLEQYAYLLAELAKRPEGDGTMLDHSLVLLCTEVCDGNTHLHDDMPMVLAGRAGGAVMPGRYLHQGYRRHGDLLAAIAHAIGEPVSGWGQESGGPLPGVLA